MQNTFILSSELSNPQIKTMVILWCPCITDAYIGKLHGGYMLHLAICINDMTMIILNHKNLARNTTGIWYLMESVNWSSLAKSLRYILNTSTFAAPSLFRFCLSTATSRLLISSANDVTFK